MIHSKKWIFKNEIHQANVNVKKKTVQKDKIKNPNWGLLLRTLAWYFLKDFSNLNIKPKIGLIMLSWKLLMATDFMNVAAHSVEFVRCIKFSFRTHPGKYCFGISKLFSKLQFTSLFFGYNKIKRILAHKLTDFNIWTSFICSKLTKIAIRGHS